MSAEIDTHATWRRLSAGDFTNALDLTPAWAWVAASARWAAGLEPAPPLEASARRGESEALARGAWIHARAALCRMDRSTLDAWVKFGSAFADQPMAGQLLRAAGSLAAGEPQAAFALASSAATEAAARGDSALRVEAEALTGLAQLQAGDLVAARATARRASRMGRTESLPQSEYLAGITLAGVRRWGGQPHYAARILSALARVAPGAWKEWIALEMVLCGDLEAARAAGAEEVGPAGRWVGRMLRLEPRGEREAFEPLERITSDVEAMLDPRSPTADPGILAWRRGEGEMPDRFHGLSLASSEVRGVGCPYIHVEPGASAQRLLALGAHRLPRLPRVSAPGRQRRTARAVAQLALHGEVGLGREALFEAVYGFGFKAVTHQGTLDVLVHRARDVLAEVGEVVRDGGNVALRVERPGLIEDEPAERQLTDLVLRTIAASPGVGAREIAKELGIALRTMQTMLGELAEEGACVAEREGRRIAYRVEDTTFSEPTGLARVE